MVTKKVLKIKVGTVFIDGKSHDVFTEAWEKEAKRGGKYYEMRNPIFVQTVQILEKNAKLEVEA